MNFKPETLIAGQKAAFDSAFTVVNTLFASTERLVALNLNTARTSLEDSASFTNSLFSVKDVQDVIAIPTSLAQPALEKAMSYSRSVYEIQVQTAEELARLAEDQRAEFNKSIFAALDSVAKNAPAGSDVAVSAVKSAFAAANSAFDSMSKAARQVADVAEANVTAATNATVKAVKPVVAASKGKKAA